MAKNTTIDTILRTKLHRPPVPGDYVHRPRLLEYLDQRRERPLTLVSAPAGYGKSVLISCWLETCDIPNAWLSLDEHDSDLHQFLFYFLAAIQTMFPDAVSETTTLANTSPLPPVSVLARSLTNELDSIERNFILMLDDIHLIQQKSVYDFLTELLQYPPRPMHLVLASRRDPNLPIASLRAKNQVAEVRPFDLRFTTDETAAYIQTVLGEQINEDTAAILAKKSEGWITGLHLAVLAMRKHENTLGKLLELKGTTLHVKEYLMTEVMDAQSPAVRHYLLITSILNRFCAPLCDELWQPDSERGEDVIDGAAFIAKLQKDNLFLITLDTENFWFRHHHLFQQLLRDQLSRRRSPEEIAGIHSRASDWFEENGLIDEAIEHALAAKDALAAAKIIERNRHVALDNEQYHMLQRWLNRIPPEIQRARPSLQLGHAWIKFISAQVEAMLPVIECVESLLEKSPESPTLLNEARFFRGVLYYFQGDGARSAEIFTKTKELLSENSSLSLRSEVEYWDSVALHLAGRKETAIQRLYQKLQDPELQETMILSRLRFGLCLIHMLDGGFVKAFQEGQKLTKLCRSIGFVNGETWSEYVQGNAAFQMGDLDAAQCHFSWVVENQYRAGSRPAIDAMAGLAITFQFIGKTDEADETMRLAQEYAEWTKESECFDIVYSCRARLALLRGDIDSASRWQRSFSETTVYLAMLFFLEIPVITECRVLIAVGSDAGLKEAIERLADLQQNAKAWQNTCQTIEIMVLQALASYHLGQLEAALETLAQAVAMAMPGGSIRPFVELGRPMADLLKKLAEKSVAVDYVTTLLAAFRDVEAEPIPDALASTPVTVLSPCSQPLLEPLTHRELDVLELLAKRLQNKEIAEKLFISTETVKAHLRNIYQKLNIGNRREAVSRAIDLGILTR